MGPMLPRQAPPQGASGRPLPGCGLTAGPPPGLRTESAVGGRDGRRGPAARDTHLQLAVLIHRQVAGLQVLQAEERRLCGPPAGPQGQGRGSG